MIIARHAIDTLLFFFADAISAAYAFLLIFAAIVIDTPMTAIAASPRHYALLDTLITPPPPMPYA